MAICNGIINPSMIYVGQQLVICGATLTPVETAPAGIELIHIVQAGENLYRLAIRYGVTVQGLALRNGIINPNLIYVGQRLVIPAAGASPTLPEPVEGELAHIVLPGENLYRIALEYGLSYKTVASYNGIAWPYTIFSGQVIRIPPGN